MKYIDTHAHIYAEEFQKDVPETIDRCLTAGVGRIYMPNIDATSFDGMLELEQKYPDITVPMMGLHPCSVTKDLQKELYKVEEWFVKRSFVALGEIGIDLYWDTSLQKEQEEALRIQIELAKKHKVPIILHCRNSFKETISIVEELMDDSLSGIFHCFTGNLQEAQRVLDLSTFYLGVGGVSTFKNGGMDKVLPMMNLDKIVLETDSPYLAPVPHRGKRNEPSYIPLIAERVSALMNVEIEEVARITTQNANDIFQK